MSGASRNESGTRHFPLALVVALIVAVGLFSSLAWGWMRVGSLIRQLGDLAQANLPARSESVEEARLRRQSPVAEPAPAPLPEGLPLLGQVGEDRYGMPTQYVDGPALRSLLFHKKHAALTQAFEQLQQEFEKDQRKEYWPIDCADAFASAEPGLREQLDAWAAATPKSFAPYVARGTYLNSVAWARRGGRVARETDKSDFASMERTFRSALSDLDRALAIQPKSIAAWKGKINAFRGLSVVPEGRDAIEHATALCPSCLQVRASFMMQLRPRWAGSRSQMRAFASSVGNEDKKLRILRGYPFWDEAFTHHENKDDEKALVAIERACSYGDHWEFLLMRGDIHYEMKQTKAAVADMNAALRLRPGLPEIQLHRALALSVSKHWEEAGRDLLAGLRTRLTDPFARDTMGYVISGLINEGWEHHKAGRREDALRLFDLAAELQPQNREVQQRRAFILGNRSGPRWVKAPVVLALRAAGGVG